MTDLYQVINSFFESFNVYDATEQVAFGVFVGAFILAAVLRIGAYLSYQTKYGIFTVQTKKKVPTIDSAKKFPDKLVGGIFREYMALGDNGVGNIDVRALVEKAMPKLNFSKKIVSAFEKSPLLLGALAVFVFADKEFFCVTALLAFALCVILRALFDYDAIYDKFRDELIFFVSRELGKFYVSDSANAVNKLKMEIRAVISEYSAASAKSVNEFGKAVVEKIDFATEKLWKNAEGSVNRIADRVAELSAPLGGWIETLNTAQAAQIQLNTAAANIAESAGRVSAVFDKNGQFFAAFTEKLVDNGNRLNGEITRLISSVSDLKEAHTLSAAALEGAMADLEFIKENQAALKTAVSGFELMMQDMTASMGASFAQIVNFNMKETLTNLANSTGDNINLITKANYEITERMEALFSRLAEQSKAQSDAIMHLTDIAS